MAIEISRRARNPEVPPETKQLLNDYPDLIGVFARNRFVSDYLRIFYEEKKAMGVLTALNQCLRKPLIRDANDENNPNRGRQCLDDSVSVLSAVVDKELKHPEGKTPDEIEALKERQRNLAKTMANYDAKVKEEQNEEGKPEAQRVIQVRSR
jgi:hypothetical protein